MRLQRRLLAFAQNNPLIFVGSVLIAQHLPLLGVLLLPMLPFLMQRLVLQLGLTLYAIALLFLLNGWRSAGLNSPKCWRSLHLLWMPLLFFALYLSQNTQVIDRQALLISLVAQFMTGFSEEIVFRGVMLPALLSLGVLRATLLSSVLFGFSHWVRSLFGMPMDAVLLLMSSAAIDGVLFSALRLRTHTIWTAIVVHTLGNVVGDVAHLPEQKAIALSLAGSVALCFYGLWLLRPATHPQILKLQRQA